MTFFGSSSTAAFRSLTASERRPIPRNVIARALYTTPSLNPHWRDRSKSDNASTYLKCMRIRQHVEHIEIREPVVVSHRSHAYALLYDRIITANNRSLSLSLSLSGLLFLDFILSCEALVVPAPHLTSPAAGVTPLYGNGFPPHPGPALWPSRSLERPNCVDGDPTHAKDTREGG